MIRWVPVLLLLAAGACGTGPSEPQLLPARTVLVGQLEVSAANRIVADSLSVEVSIVNVGPDPVDVSVYGGACEMFVRIYTDTGSVLVYDEGQAACPSIGTIVTLHPAESTTVVASRPLSGLRDAGVAGAVQIVAVVPSLRDEAGRLLAVSAGPATF